MDIAQRRMSKNMTQQQLGDALGVGRSTVAMWEAGSSLPRADLIPKIAQVLGCAVGDLFAVSTPDTQQ